MGDLPASQAFGSNGETIEMISGYKKILKGDPTCWKFTLTPTTDEQMRQCHKET